MADRLALWPSGGAAGGSGDHVRGHVGGGRGQIEVKGGDANRLLSPGRVAVTALWLGQDIKKKRGGGRIIIKEVEGSIRIKKEGSLGERRSRRK